MPAAAARPHSDAVVAALTDADVLVGRGGVPDGAEWQGEPGDSDFVPYAVLYPAAGIPDGDLADVNEYLDYSAQLTCVGATQDGAEAVTDLVKAALIGQILTVADRFAYPVRLTLDRPASRDDQTRPVVHYAVIQIAFRTGPA